MPTWANITSISTFKPAIHIHRPGNLVLQVLKLSAVAWHLETCSCGLLVKGTKKAEWITPVSSKPSNKPMLHMLAVDFLWQCCKSNDQTLKSSLLMDLKLPRLFMWLSLSSTVSCTCCCNPARKSCNPSYVTKHPPTPPTMLGNVQKNEASSNVCSKSLLFCN